MTRSRWGLAGVVLTVTLGLCGAWQHGGPTALYAAGADDDPFGEKPAEHGTTANTDPFAEQPAEHSPPAHADPVVKHAHASPASQGAEPGSGSHATPPVAGSNTSPMRAPRRPIRDHPAPLRTGEDAIEQTLDETTSLEFVETPLQDVVDYLSDQHKVLIVLDKKSLSDVGIAVDQPLTANLRDVSLRSALGLMLEQVDLTWTIRHDALVITTPEPSEGSMAAKVYDVADLVTCRDEKDTLWEDYDSLIMVITASIDPTTWDDVGGPGSIHGVTFGNAKVLIVSQTYETHRQMARLLEQIREIARSTSGDGQPPRRSQTKPADTELHGDACGIDSGMGRMGGGMGMF